MTPIRPSEELYEAIERAARIARLERRERRVRDLEAEVAAFLAENPDASANAVHAAVGGRRVDVLRVVREERSRSNPVPVRREPLNREGSC